MFDFCLSCVEDATFLSNDLKYASFMLAIPFIIKDLYTCSVGTWSHSDGFTHR